MAKAAKKDDKKEDEDGEGNKEKDEEEALEAKDAAAEGKVRKVLRRRLRDGTKEVLVSYEGDEASAWIPEDGLPHEMKEALNPNMADVPKEVLFDWFSQAFVATRGEEEKKFSVSQWAGLAKAKQAALKSAI